jgi:hypothetical protein
MENVPVFQGFYRFVILCLFRFSCFFFKIKILFLYDWRRHFGCCRTGPCLIQFIFKCIQHSIFDFLSHLIVNRMGNILVAAVFTFPGGHRYKVTLRTIDHFQPPYDKTIIKGNTCERFELLFIP